MSLRPCPVCEGGQVESGDLYQGARCTYCHRIIELDFFYIVGIPLFLALISGACFNYDLMRPGLLATLLIVLFTSTYANVLAKYLPVKHYGDSD